ncbi:uncharacterized protein LOC130445885 [Diorhabda sublineata]|uniref:uncharacterized protein LOC130445885 n=1 Tax=Diorhabda sublineata TaxID=1163346 RepID=UPI0024E0F7BE|nr:uncharacterized protein LOC130445885 [Diorhabda sublineata]
MAIIYLNACGLTINDDVRRTSICSRHFKAEDICQSNIFGIVKSSIKRNAVPSIYVKNPININTSNKPQSNTPLSDLFNGNGVFHPLSYILEKSSEKSLSQCQKRKFFEPSYVSEISSTDFSTPKKAKITIDLIKKTDKRKTEKIKRLQRQTRNLQKKVVSLKELINHLKDKRTLKDESGDALKLPCCIKACNNQAKIQHRFPNPEKHRKRFDEWLRIIGDRSLQEMNPYKVYEGKRICHNHFEKDYFSSTSSRLHRNAFPSLLLNRQDTSASVDILDEHSYANIHEITRFLNIPKCIYEDHDYAGAYENR